MVVRAVDATGDAKTLPPGDNAFLWIDPTNEFIAAFAFQFAKVRAGSYLESLLSGLKAL